MPLAASQGHLLSDEDRPKALAAPARIASTRRRPDLSTAASLDQSVAAMLAVSQGAGRYIGNSTECQQGENGGRTVTHAPPGTDGWSFQMGESTL